MDFKTIKEFHWLTKTVIVLTALPIALLGFIFVAALLGHPDVGNGLGNLLMAMLYILSYVLLGILVIIGVSYAFTWAAKTWAASVRPHLALTGVVNPGDTQEIKAWVEKQAGSLSESRAEVVDLKAEIRLLRQSIDAMQKKVDNIESILEKVAE